MSTSEESKLVVLETLEDYENFIKSDKVSIIDFWASWCGPCIAIAPWYEEMAEKHSSDKMQIGKCDVDNNSEASEKAKISCMPTFKVYKDDTLLNTIEGANKKELEKMFELKNDEEIEKLKQKQVEEEMKKLKLEQTLPMIKNITEYDAFIKEPENQLTFINFYVNDYKDEVDELLNNLLKEVENEENKKLTSNNVRRVDLNEHGKLGNELKIRSLPHLRVCYNNELVDIIEKNDMDLINKFTNMTEDDFKNHINAKKEKEEKLKKLVPQHDTKEDYDNFLKADNDETKLTVVDYYATWCGPCIGFAPKFLEIAGEYNDENKNVQFCKIDCDKNSHAKTHGDVKCYPTFKLWKNGVEVGKLEGANGDKLKELINKNLSIK